MYLLRLKLTAISMCSIHFCLVQSWRRASCLFVLILLLNILCLLSASWLEQARQRRNTKRHRWNTSLRFSARTSQCKHPLALPLTSNPVKRTASRRDDATDCYLSPWIPQRIRHSNPVQFRANNSLRISFTTSIAQSQQWRSYGTDN
jgi:hypothetical protein